MNVGLIPLTMHGDGLTFIIFDLEVTFLFPWAVSLHNVGPFGFWAMMIFLGVLTVGFVYEWRKGALDWE
jgi:NADH-quinone oxidoreductase subunit A